MGTNKTCKNSSLDEDAITTACTHEAGHCVMRWARTGVVTDSIVYPDGSGCSFASESRIRLEDNVLISLAGIAAETGCGLLKIDLQRSMFADLDYTRSVLSANDALRIKVSERLECETIAVEEALQYWFGRACESLSPWFGLVELVSGILESNVGHVVTGNYLESIGVFE
ncbi:hypothetical protein SH467x_000599 [Pirellulaceae bacterium SH467]